MEKLELDELVSKTNELFDTLKADLDDENYEAVAQYLTCFEKLYNEPETPWSIYSDFLTVVEKYSDIIYDGEMIDVSFAIGSLEKFCELAPENEKKEFLFDYVEKHLLLNMTAEGFAKEKYRFEDTSWFKFGVKCEDAARKLGWSGRYKDADTFQKLLEDSDIGKMSNQLIKNCKDHSIRQNIDFSFALLIGGIKKFVEANPQIECKDALMGLYSYSDASDAALYKKNIDKYGTINDVFDIVTTDFSDNDFYGKPDAYLIYMLIMTLTDVEEEADIIYSISYFLLEKAFEMEIRGCKPIMAVDLAFSGYATICDFMYWYKRIYLGINDAGEPLKYRSGSEKDLLKESSTSNAAQKDFDKNKVLEKLSASNSAENSNTSVSDTTSTSQPSNNSQYEEEEVGGDFKKGLIYAAIPLIAFIPGCLLLFIGIGIIFILITFGMLIYMGKHQFPEIMFHAESVIINKNDLQTAVNFIKDKFKAKHFYEIEGDNRYNFHKGMPENPTFGVELYKVKDDPEKVKISIFVSNLTSKGGLPKGYLKALKLKDDFALELKEKFGV